MVEKTRNRFVGDEPARGFESHLLRHVVADFVSFATTFYSQESSLIHCVAPPFRIEPASLGFDSVWVQTWKLNEIRFSNNFFEKRISSFRKALQ